MFACCVILHVFCHPIFFYKITFSKISLRNTIRVSNSLDPAQAQHFVGLDLGLKCFILNINLVFAFALCVLSKCQIWCCLNCHVCLCKCKHELYMLL